MSQSPPSFNRRRFSLLRFSVTGIFFLLVIGFLYVTKPVFLPVFLALVVALILSPINQLLIQRLHLPSMASALLIVLTLTVGLAAVSFKLAAPIGNYVSQMEDEDVQTRLANVFQPVKDVHGEISNVVEKIETISSEDSSEEDGDSDSTEVEITSDQDKTEVTTTVQKKSAKKRAGEEGEEDQKKTKKSKKPVTVAIDQNRVGAVYGAIQEFGFYFVSTMFLVLFFLAYGDCMASRMGRTGVTGELIAEIKRDVSAYLFTITTINFFLGVVIAASLHVAGVKDAYLWGLMAFLLNFIPYAGAVIGTGIVILVVAISAQALGPALVAGAIYMGLSSIEGNLITPAVIGERFSINPIIVFIWVLGWAALWGLPGMLICLPILMAFRIVCSRVPMLASVEKAITL